MGTGHYTNNSLLFLSPNCFPLGEMSLSLAACVRCDDVICILSVIGVVITGRCFYLVSSLWAVWGPSQEKQNKVIKIIVAATVVVITLQHRYEDKSIRITVKDWTIACKLNKKRTHGFCPTMPPIILIVQLLKQWLQPSVVLKQHQFTVIRYSFPSLQHAVFAQN